jgi:hypothetical protein
MTRNLPTGMAEAANGAYRRSTNLMNGAVMRGNVVTSVLSLINIDNTGGTVL